jgi:tetratricopeptide (TPR) repeat protein
VSDPPHKANRGVNSFRLSLSKFPRRIFLSVIFFASAIPSAFCRPAAAPQESDQASFDVLAKSATAAREAGETEEAVRNYQRALDLRADWEEGWWYLGTLQYDANHFSEAVPALQKVVQIDPAFGPAWNFLGLCEFETHDYENSLTHLQKAQELGANDDPEISRVAKYHLALLLNRRGEFEKAFAMLASMYANQTSAQIRVALGLALLRVPLLPQEVDPSQDALVQAAGDTASILAQAGPEKNLDSFRSLLKKYPNVPYLHYAFGTALASASQNEEAFIQQREELKISPKSPLPYLEISSLELRLHHPQEALRAAQMAVRLASDSSTAHRALGASLLAVGEKERSAEEIRTAEAVAPEKTLRETRIIQMYEHAATVSTENAQVASSKTNLSSASFAERSRQAAAEQTAGRSDEAIHIYQKALQLHPEWDEGWWNLAMLSYSAGDYPEAITALKTCVARKPDNGTAWAVMGLSEFEIKDYNNALIHLQRGQELGMGGSTESVQLAKYRLGILLNRNAEFDRVTEVLAQDAGPGPLAAKIQFVLGMALLRIPALPEQLEASKSKLVQTAGEIAILLQESKYDEVFPKFQALLRQYPSVPFLHYAYATALAAISQYDDAESQLRQELLISPRSALPYSELASVALKAHRPEDALPSSRRAVELAPESAEAHYLLGRSCLELGQEENAIRELETAEKMAPGSPEIHFNLAKAYAKNNLPEKAEQERGTFVRLNALAEQRRSQHGNQSYSGSHGNSDLSIPSVGSNATPQN